MNKSILKDKICDYFWIMENEHIQFLEKMIRKNHLKNAKKIIEENTDIFSVYHYETVDLIAQKDNITYWAVREISSGKAAVINSNREFILPFDNYGIIEADKEGKNIVCFRNREKILFDFNGKFLKGKFENNKNVDIAEQTFVNMINEIKISDDKKYSKIKEKLSIYEEDLNVVKKFAQKLERSDMPHSIFDYRKVKFFTNNLNQLFFALIQKDSDKYGLVDICGDLIVPFKYDDLGGFVIGEGDYIHMGIGSKYGLLDCLGNVVVEAISDNVISFYDGLAIIEQNKKFGYVDLSGNVVIPVIYDDARRFMYGKAEVTLNNEKFYINNKGERLEVISIY